MRAAPRVRRWLTSPKSDPSVRFRYWTEVEGKSPAEPVVQKARGEIGVSGWAAGLLAFQLPRGQWVSPGTTPQQLVRPRYSSTHWVAIVLADLGVTRADPRIRKTAELILRWRKSELDAKDAELCFTGNAVRTLVRFGYLDHPVVQKSIAWIVSNQKADGGWNCFPSQRGVLDAWEGLAALAEIPEDSRDGSVRRSIERGAEFYLKRRLMVEGSDRYAPWFRIHYPNHFFYDLLVGLRMLTRLGYGGDARLKPAVKWLQSQRNRGGTWELGGIHPNFDENIPGYTFRQPILPLMLEGPGQPSQWATVEALSVLSRVEAS
jgi:hypothetical protein